MKAVFLDVDGVLVIPACWADIGPDGVPRSGLRTRTNPEAVALLNRITRETGARIVVSSVWRLGGVRKIRTILRGWGVVAPVIGVTPDLRRAAGMADMKRYFAIERGHEIQHWLDHWTRAAVDSFVILDDDPDMAHLAHRLVRTDFMVGLTEEHAARAIAMLTNGSLTPPAR